MNHREPRRRFEEGLVLEGEVQQFRRRVGRLRAAKLLEQVGADTAQSGQLLELDARETP